MYAHACMAPWVSRLLSVICDNLSLILLNKPVDGRRIAWGMLDGDLVDLGIISPPAVFSLTSTIPLVRLTVNPLPVSTHYQYTYRTHTCNSAAESSLSCFT